MREILFRGKRVDNGEWVEGDFSHPNNIVFESIGYDDVLKQDNVPIWNDFEVDPETIGEYTGVTDKNGKKIFEGDLVKIDGKYIRQVAYSGEYTAFCAMHVIDRQQSELTGTLGDGYDNYKRQYEVVGNIYDNPELL